MSNDERADTIVLANKLLDQHWAAHIERLCDSIDAAVFSGDQFMEAPARARLRFYMARWELELKAFESVDADDCNHEDDGEGTCLGCGQRIAP